MNIATFLQMSADAFGDRQAISDECVSLTYSEWYRAAQQSAEYFLQSGCKFVATLDAHSAVLPIAMYGAALAGIPYVPLNYRLTDSEIDSLLERIPSFLLITSADRVEPYTQRHSSRIVAANEFLSMSTSEPSEGASAIEPPFDEEGIAVQLFTSGTTGAPKVAPLRHKNIAAYILGSVDFGCAGDDDAVVVAVPPYHIAGISAVISAVFAGRRIVLLPSFDAETWLNLARSQRASNAFLVPTMLVRIIEYLDDSGEQANLPALKSLAYGGGKMPESIIRRALELFPEVGFANAYGLTETSSTITVLGPEVHRAALSSDDESIRKRLTSVGVALPSVEIEVRDEDGSVLPANQVGEIYVRGEQVSGEYVGKGSLLDADGWFPTRDSGYFDTGAYLYLTGRTDDVIVRGGENISPGEVEEALMAHSAVADAAVFGISSEQWGETVVAAIQLRPKGEVPVEELQQWVRQRLRSSRVPEQIIFRDALPYTETGKLLRRTLKDELCAVDVIPSARG
jgi:long-chain acyl-CoA synthetase